MKHRFIILTLFFLPYLSLFSQEDIGRNIQIFELIEDDSFKDVLSQIGNKHNVLLAYPSQLMNEKVKSVGSIQYTDVENLLAQVFEDLQYDVKKVSDERYLLRLNINPDQEKNLPYISGIVQDASTGEALTCASVYYSDFSDGSFTDANGNFTIKHSGNENDSLIFSFLSYHNQTFALRDIIDKQTISLAYSQNVIEDILVEYFLPPLLNSDDGMALILNDNLSQSHNLVSNDLMRQIQMLPGVGAHNDDESNLKIRGSNSDQSNIILDGMPLYKVDHYYGIFSSVNSDFVDDVKLFKNAQPIQYLAYGGGLLQLESDSDYRNFSGQANINLLNSSANFKIPLSEKINVNIGLRSTYRNVDDGGLINLKSRESDSINFQDNATRIFITNEPEFRFHDVNGKINFQLSERSKLSYSIFESKDRFINSYDLTFEGPNKTESQSIYKNEEMWNNFSNALQFETLLKSDLSWKSQIYFTAYDQSSHLESELKENQNRMLQRKKINNLNESSIKDLGASSYIKSSFSHHNFTLGTEYKRYSTVNLLSANDTNIIDQDFNSNLTSFFGAYEFKNDNFIIELGNRFNYYQNKKFEDWYLSPQLTALYRINSQQKFKFSISTSQQFLREIDFESRQNQTIQLFTLSKRQEIPVLKTTNVMLGYSAQKSKWSFDLEAYWKSMEGVLQLTTIRPGIIDSQQEPQASEYRLYAGERNIVGLDLMLSYDNKWYSSWIAYTLSKSLDKFSNIFKGKEFQSEDDRRHQIKWINNISYSNFSFSNNVVYASGKPYLPLEELNDMQDRLNLDPNALLKSLPAYFRVDLGIDYHFKMKNVDASVGVSMFNVFNRQNVKYIQYAYKIQNNNPGSGQSRILGTEGELLNRTLNVNFDLKF